MNICNQLQKDLNTPQFLSPSFRDEVQVEAVMVYNTE